MRGFTIQKILKTVFSLKDNLSNVYYTYLTTKVSHKIREKFCQVLNICMWLYILKYNTIFKNPFTIDGEIDEEIVKI